jgi:DNA-damage-inducible protein D
MTDLELFTATAPFDAIRHQTPEGREYWSARDLQPLLGYSKWEDFANAIARAKISAANSGVDVATNFPTARKVAASGPAAQDYHLSRYACYLTALNGDPRKPEIAAAQTLIAKGSAA